jgi:DNA-binding transcriptional LysR family regulator
MQHSAKLLDETLPASNSSQSWLPDWELLSSWVAVMETGSISEAAIMLHVSQATISQRISRLEAMFAATLLDRTAKPAQPTPAGQQLFESAKDLLTRADEMIEGVRSMKRAS